MNFGNNGDDYDPILPHKAPYDMNNKIMVSAIVSLTVVIIAVVILHIYARCSMRQRQSGSHSGAALQQRNPNSTARASSSEVSKNGLDPTVLALLPMFVFKRNIYSPDHDDFDNKIECAVCLSMLEEGETIRLLPNCNHSFHLECIDKWFCSQSTCPICRTEATPKARQASAPPDEVSVPIEDTPQLPRSTEIVESNDGGLATNMACGCGEEGRGPSSCPQGGGKVGGGSSFRLSSFRKMINRDVSSSRIQDCREDDMEDLEGQ